MKKVIMNVVQTYMVLLEPAFSAQAPQYYQHRIYVIDTDCRQVNFKRMFKYSISYIYSDSKFHSQFIRFM